MSILKGILHHWNKTNNAYDTIHPETESAQVTDWNSGIVNTLASTALGSLVSTLSSDSLLAKLIGKVLDATGVKYSMSTNGYICFGSLFGGLIIQWVIVGTSNSFTNVHMVLPITYTKQNFVTVGTSNGATTNIGITDLMLNSFNIATSYATTTYVISIGH